MNGYTMMADSYKRLMKQGEINKEEAEKKIRIYEFLATCDVDDFCRMVNSSAFNDIIMSFLEMAVEKSGIDEIDQEKVKDQLRWIFYEKSAKEVLNHYKNP